MLTNGQYTLRIVDMHGKGGQYDEWVSIDYGFGNTTQIGTFVLPASACNPDVQLLSHEIEVWRNKTLEFVGVITGREADRGQITYTTSDLSYWLFERMTHQLHQYNYVGYAKDAAIVFGELWEDAMSVDPKRVKINVNPCGVVYDKDVPRFTEIKGVIDDLQQLVDWEVRGRTINVGSASLNSNIRFKLTDDDWRDPDDIKIRESAEGLTTTLAMSGVLQGAADEQLAVATFQRLGTRNQGKYGVHERVVVNNSLTRKSQIDVMFHQTFDTYAMPMRYVQTSGGGGLRHDANVRFSDLRPGARAHVTSMATCIPVNQWLRLASVRVTVDSEGVESVAPDFGPLGAVATNGDSFIYDEATGGE